MSEVFGSLKEVNLLDNIDAGHVPDVYVELTVAQSPVKEVFCGAIATWRRKEPRLPLLTALTDADLLREMEAVRETLRTQPEEMVTIRPLQRFAEGRDGVSRGDGVAHAMTLLLRDVAEYKPTLIGLYCPRLGRILAIQGPDWVKARSDGTVGRWIKDCADLMQQGFTFDPWTGTVRRGEVSAQMKNR